MKKTLAIMLALIMVLALVPTVAFAADEVAWINGQGYTTLGDAVKAAKSGDTITLGEGKYSLYDVCGHGDKKNTDYTLGKDLTFIGKGTDKTFWGIGAKLPDPAHFGTEFNSDYSFDARSTVEKKETIKFQNMTLQSGKVDYLGFSGTDNTIVEDCIIEGKTFFWGYTSATFTNTTFNCPKSDYAVWTYCSPTMSFYNCTFNSTGKVINVYTDYSAGKHDITVNFNNCTVNNTDESLKPVLNINDKNMGNYKYILNITGDNNVTGVDVDKITCSRLFGFGGEEEKNTGRSNVTINDIKVWEGGKRVCDHNGVVFPTGSYNGDKTTQYTDGYKDKAFTVTPNGPGSFVVTCVYCGYTETSNDGLYNDIGLARTVNQNSNPVSADAANSNIYKVANSSDITVDYTATMNMENLRWEKQGSLSAAIPNPWELLAAQPDWITEDTVVFLKFTFDKNINLGTFQTNYNKATTTEAKEKLLKLESNMFKIADEGGVHFDIEKREMTIKCNWNWNKEAGHAPDPKITLYGFGLPVKDNWGGSEIDIKNSGCVSGTVHIKKPRTEAAVAMVEPVLNVAANQESIPTPSLDTIQIPIVGGCKTDKFTLYYGGGSSGDSSGGSSSGGGYYHPTTTPVPVIVIPPKTGDMTVWQSILHFLGIR